MNFTINGQTANITLEQEETVGELLSGFEQWLQQSDQILSGIIVDGEKIDSESISEIFLKKLDEVNTIDFKTTSRIELYFEALFLIRAELEGYENASYEDKKWIQQNWIDGAAASFIKHSEPSLFDMLNGVFSGEGLNPKDAASIVSERIRELENPVKEIGGIQSIIDESVKRLIDLPLDLQTGKDFRAAETIQLFSGICEKLFRILAVMEGQGVSFKDIKVDDKDFNVFMGELSAALQELFSAYESKDSVLVGDLAEYELAPRLHELYAAVNNPRLFYSQEDS